LHNGHTTGEPLRVAGAGDTPGGQPRAASHIAFFFPQLGPGAVANTTLLVSEGLARRDHRVDLLPCKRKRGHDQAPPANCRLLPLARSGGLRARWQALRAFPALLGTTLPNYSPWLQLPFVSHHLPALVAYLRRERPVVLCANLTPAGIAAVQARRLAGVDTRVVVIEHNAISQVVAHARHPDMPQRVALLRWMFRQADRLITPSEEGARDLAGFAGLDLSRVTGIHNPVVTPALLERARQPCAHPWLQGGGPPVILGCGRLSLQKDFAMLIRAFARVRKVRPARLIILGAASGEAETAREKTALRDLAASLGVVADVALPGFVDNPLPFMARSAVFALSSRFEGLANVLVEAMACGCPVVSTDCPVGPAEVLARGRYGRLAPVGDERAFARALLATLAGPPDRRELRERAARFSVEAAVSRYEAALLGNP